MVALRGERRKKRGEGTKRGAFWAPPFFYAVYYHRPSSEGGRFVAVIVGLLFYLHDRKARRG